MRRALVTLIALGFGSIQCGSSVTESPFPQGSGGEGADGGAPSSSGGRGGGSNDPTLGTSCLDDGQCDDGIDCTADACDNALARCRHVANDDLCADDSFCNGIEVCDLSVGCRSGPPTACSDETTCTIDRCVEETRSCEHVPRDADGDGDPVRNCGGSDCDDSDASVNGKRPEVCANGADDDCDGFADEADCVAPAHDECVDALEIDRDEIVELSLVAATESVALSCVEPGGIRRDVVVALIVSGNVPRDIEVTATSTDPGLALAFRGACTEGATDLACSEAVTRRVAAEGQFSRLHLYGVKPGAYPLYVSGLNDSSVTVSVRYDRASEPPQNETCGTAAELTDGSRLVADLAGAVYDVEGACSRRLPELVYRFELDEASDIVARATALDGYGIPALSLRSARCTALAEELDCRSAQPARLFARALPAGVYYLALGATTPSAVELSFDVLPASAPDPDEGCDDPPPLTSGSTIAVDLGNHVNSVASECLPGALDATYALGLDARSDVLLVERLSAGDTGAVSLLAAGCAANSERSCKSSATSPVRARAFGLPPGDYAVVAESRNGSPIELSAFTRPAAPEVAVAFADGCDDAVLIPDTGGRFSGNTGNFSADFEASCDYGGVSAGGASDQMLRLHLEESRRVILDMSGTQYSSMLVVRRALGCPGPELLHACAPGRGSERSFLDLTLEAGDYFVQIDGFANAKGPWKLDVYFGTP